jgi:hypothetical protein
MAKGYVYPGLGQEDSLYTVSLSAVRYDEMADFKDVNFIDDVSKKTNGDIVQSFVLPLPNNIAESISHGWEITQGLSEELSNMAGGVAEAIAGSSVADIVKKKANSAGINIDPNYRQIYNGTQPRTFDFSWIFIPQSLTEAKWVQNMILSIKKHSAPQGRTATVLIKPPLSWQINFANKTLSSLLKMKSFVMTSFSADYTGQGYGNFYYDGSPKQINVSMTFSERYTLSAEDWV